MVKFIDLFSCRFGMNEASPADVNLHVRAAVRYLIVVGKLHQ